MVWLPLWLVELSSQNNLCWWLCWEQAGRCSWASHSACFINESHLLRGQVQSGLGSLEKVTHASRGWQLIHPSHALRVCLLRHYADWVLGVRTNDTFSPTSRVTFKRLFLKDHSGFAHWVPIWLHPYRSGWFCIWSGFLNFGWKLWTFWAFPGGSGKEPTCQCLET